MMAGGLGIFALGAALFPLFYVRYLGPQNLTTSTEKLSGQTVIRGAFMNSGSKDAGADPDWDFANRLYKGRPVGVKDGKPGP